MKVVGNHLQVVMVEQCAGDRFGRCANVDEQRGMVGNLRGYSFGDALFLVAHLVGAHGVGGVLDARVIRGAPVVAAQQVELGKLVDVATDGLRGDDEQLRHFFDADVAAFADQLEDLLLARGQIHGRSFWAAGQILQ
ncbi:hypothetical protein D3C81_1261710 [compost metagenome]